MSQRARLEQDQRFRVPYGEGRQALLDATIAIVARDGLSKLTTRALTSEARVSQGSLQHHFGTINEVVAAALEHCVENTLGYFPAPDALHQIFDGIISSMRENPREAVFQTVIFLEARHRPDLLELVTRHQERYGQNLRVAIISLGLSADEDLVQLLIGLGDGVAYEYAVFGDAYLSNGDRQIRALRRLLEAYETESRLGRDRQIATPRPPS